MRNLLLRQHQLPDLLTLSAGPLASEISVIWAGSHLADYLLAPALRRQVWGAWLHMRKPGETDVDADLARFHVTTASNRVLLTEAFGYVPPGMPGALGRLGPSVVGAPVYRGLFTVLSEGGEGAKLIMHDKTLETTTILILAALPKCLRLKRVLRACNVRQAHVLGWLTRRLSLAQHSLPPDLRIKIEQADAADEIECILVAYAGPASKFGAPPVEVSGLIRPLDSPASLMSTAKTFENCLHRYIDAVRDGSFYFYVLEGEEPAVIGLRRLPSLQNWVVDQVSGKGNKTVTANTRKTIAAAFTDATSVYSDWLLEEAWE